MSFGVQSLRSTQSVQFNPRSESSSIDGAVRQFLSMLSPQAKEQLGRMLANALERGSIDPQMLQGMLGARSNAVDPRTLGPSPTGQPPRLGGAASGNVVVRGQDGSAFPVNDDHVSSPQEARWVLDKLRGMGLNGQVNTQQYNGFYGIDYSQSGNNRIFTVGVAGNDTGTSQINVGLVARMYQTMPKSQADAILACDLKYLQQDAALHAAAER